jgi:hypothetical protein
MKKTNLSNNLDKVVASLVKSLSARNKDIITRRFGLKNGKKETLESIGKGYGITRERVRQIEESVLAQLTKDDSNLNDLSKYISAAKGIISNNGGVIKERDLFEAFSGSREDNAVNASLVFTLTLDADAVKLSDNDHFYALWAKDKNHLQDFKNMVDSVVSTLSKAGKVTTRDELVSSAKKNGIKGVGSSQVDGNQIDLALSINKDVSQNIFNQIGLASWSEVNPKGVRDKAYLVLKKEGAPKHFSDIAKLINTHGFDTKKANVQTVHNELIKDSRFVLVGRGMYALNEWGYKPGTVKEVLVDILRSHGKPMPKPALLAKVMTSRMVKENTVLLNLQDSKVFRKNEEGHFVLREV